MRFSDDKSVPRWKATVIGPRYTISHKIAGAHRDVSQLSLHSTQERHQDRTVVSPRRDLLLI